jgi:hypothetical protein
MKAMWLRPEFTKDGTGKAIKEEVSVTIHGYSQASYGEGIRPVAIVSEDLTGKMQYVELKFLTLVPEGSSGESH